MRIVYLAGPYRGKTRDGASYNEIEANIRQAEKAAIALWDAGFGVFCPHLNTAHFEVKSTTPPELYLQADLRMLDACTDILMLPGWKESAGAKRELHRARELGLAVYYSLEGLLSEVAR